MHPLERHWPFVAICLVLFALVMAGLHWLTKGISPDFGYGFSLGGIIFGVLTTLALGWRRQGPR